MLFILNSRESLELDNKLFLPVYRQVDYDLTYRTGLMVNDQVIDEIEKELVDIDLSDKPVLAKLLKA